MKPGSPVLPHYPGLAQVTFGAEQPGYLPLPAVKGYCSGLVTTRWTLSWRERLRLLLGGSLWLQTLTFGEPLQPQKLLVVEPSLTDCGLPRISPHADSEARG